MSAIQRCLHRLNCTSHWLSQRLKKCLIHSRQPTSLVISRLLLLLVFQTVLKNVKNFRESYVFHCLVIKVVCLATARLLYHISFSLSRTFFNSFSKFFELFRFSEMLFWSVIVGSVQATWLLYHTIHKLSSTFLIYFFFSEIILNCIFSRNNYFRQLI